MEYIKRESYEIKDALDGDDIKSEVLLSYDNWRKNYVAETEAETK